MTIPTTAWWHRLIDSTCGRPKATLSLFLSGLILIGLLAAGRADDPPLNSNLFDLIGPAAGQALQNTAVERMRSLSGQRQTWLVMHEDPGQAYDAAVLLDRKLRDSELFDSTMNRLSLADVLDFYTGYPQQLADEAALEMVRHSGESPLVERVLQTLYASAISMPMLDLERDPFLLQAGFLQRLAEPPQPWTIDRGLLRGRLDDRWVYLLPVTLNGNAFDFSYQIRVQEFSGLVSSELSSNTGAEVAAVGAIDFATANRELALTEVAYIGSASLALITLLLLVTFHHVRPFGAVVFTIVSGVAGGFAVCIASYRSINLLTLVAGSSLIGISVDYAFHLLTDSFRHAPSWRVAAGLKAVLPTVVLGLLTSLAGFAGLFASGFRGLQEIAVFSAAGLITAFFGLLMAYPALLKNWRPRRTSPALSLAKFWSRIWRPGRRTIIALAVVTVALLPFRPELDTSSDVRLLAAQSADIDTLVHYSERLSATLLDSRFIVIEAEDNERLLQREEQTRERLIDLQQRGVISGFKQLSLFVPSRKRQQETWTLNRRLFLDPGTAAIQLADRIGLTDAVLEEQRAQLAARDPVRYLELDDWLASPLAPVARDLYLGRVGDHVASIVTFSGLTDSTVLTAEFAGMPGVLVVDTVADISRSFDLYVDNALMGLTIAFGLVTALMILRFGWREGAFTMLVPAITFTATLWILLWLGEPINLFNLVGLALVLGMGMDYTLFLKSGQNQPPTMLAVLLAVLTTECAFGLLGFSQVRAIHSFGITVALGTAGAFLLARMVTSRNRNQHP